MIFNSPLLEDEISGILNNDFPEHTTLFSLIIHSELEDFYPKNIFHMDIVRDYDGTLTDHNVVSLVMTKKEFNTHIFKHRDDLQVTVVIDYNGRIHKERMKALLISNPTDRMEGDKSDISGLDASEHTLVNVELQCISFLYSMLKNITVNGVLRDSKLDSVMRHYISSEMSKVTINGKKVLPTVDMVPIHNSRVYNNTIIPDSITLLDIPTFLHKQYGVYNGGMGTYVYNNGVKDIVAIFPLYNSDVTAGVKRLVVYVPDKPIAGNVINKTVLVDGDSIRIIVKTNSKRIDNGEVADFDKGSGFKTVNSNQVLDRTLTSSGGTVTSDSSKSIDSLAVNTKAGLAAPKMLPSTDNLYAVRTSFLRGRSVTISMQWNFSRPDLLVPGMGVDIVRTENSKIIREKGTLISSYSKYDNEYKNCTTMLNIIVNI